MKSLVVAAFVLSGLAVAQTGGQATIVGGYASTWAPGAYAMQNPPLINTPEVSLDAALGTTVGASNATSGNVAGAVGATMSIVPEPVGGLFAVPAWYEPSYAPAAQMNIQPTGMQMPSSAAYNDSDNRGSARGYISLGIAESQSSEGVAQLMANEGLKPKQAAHSYTNDDVARMNVDSDQNSGVVKYNGKTERLEQQR